MLRLADIRESIGRWFRRKEPARPGAASLKPPEPLTTASAAREVPWNPPVRPPPLPRHDAFVEPPRPRHPDPSIEKMTSLEALGRLYADVWPEMRLEVRHTNSSGSSHRATWYDGPKEVGYTNVSLSRSRDGALNLFAGGARVDPAYRGRGGTNRVIPKMVTWLRENSPHPNTAITMGAGAARGEKMGPYVWANFGFDFANIHGDRVEIEHHTTARTAYGMEPEPQVFHRAFASWVDEKRKQGQLPDDEELIGLLKDASAHWQHPWEIANFEVPGLKVDFEARGKTFRYGLGKAFLMDRSTPTWTGVFFVNELDSPGARLQNVYTRRVLGHPK